MPQDVLVVLKASLRYLFNTPSFLHRLGVKHMVEVGAPDECIDEMRSFLNLEGWSQHEEMLPSGWMLRIAENSSAVKCSLMRDDGELFEDWAEGLRCLERLGKDTNKLEVMVAQKLPENRNMDNSPTSGKEVTLETEADCVKVNGSPNKLQISADDFQNKKISGVDKNVGRLPKGWRTRNTLGDKGFRIYSPPGFEL